VNKCPGKNKVVFKFPTSDPGRLLQWVLFAQSEPVKMAYLSQSSQAFSSLKICLDHFSRANCQAGLEKQRLSIKALPTKRKPAKILYTLTDLQQSVSDLSSPATMETSTPAPAPSIFNDGGNMFMEALLRETVTDTIPQSEATESVSDYFRGLSEDDPITKGLLAKIKALEDELEGTKEKIEESQEKDEYHGNSEQIEILA